MLGFSYGYMISSILTCFFVPVLVAKITNCDEGHLCSSNRECCSQGCCPTQQRISSDNVLNLFFINHWFFWSVVVAILLAILCAFSLWKKRRQFCGWRSSDNNTQSEGDSAGSCYAPPQYSRCSSFHHPPPPYTEVTSKPDLYPLVFTCNNESSKNGNSYLMVQYFRNYIVRPVGSISATSTIDSLSSSFICNANEANTLVPPPYSRATSPDNAINSNFQHFMISRSASQNRIFDENFHFNKMISNFVGNETNGKNIHNLKNQKYDAKIVNNCKQTFENKEDEISVLKESPRSEIPLEHIRNIFKRKEYYNEVLLTNKYNPTNRPLIKKNSAHEHLTTNNVTISNIKNSTSTSTFLSKNNKMYNSCNSVGGISITLPVVEDGIDDCENLDSFRRSLETCCQILQKHNIPHSNISAEDHAILESTNGKKKYESCLQSNYLSSTTCSVVSSLTNIGTPSSPPQATSPTCDGFKDILENIRQLEIDDISLNEFNKDPKNSTKRRPSMLSSKSKTFRQNKSAYQPIWNPNIRPNKSPVNTNGFFRGRKRWISLSAPTTPGSAFPQNPTENLDRSPLLQQHDEEME